MRRATPAALALLLWPLGLAAESSRTWELLRRECKTSFGRSEVTLFANGTSRLRRSVDGQRELKLAELTPEEVQAFVNRLAGEDLSEVDTDGKIEVQGDWVERCEIMLRPAGEQTRRYRFGRLDSLPLALARVNAIVDDLLATIETRAPVDRLPAGYRPQPGDLLERVDGSLFEVVAITGDSRGVELRGVDEPLTVFVTIEALDEVFVALLKQRQWP